MSEKCEIIRDLMPLCMDDTASAATRMAVEQHIQSCEDCRKAYEAMQTDIAPKIMEQELADAQSVLKLFGKRRKQRTVKNVLIIAFAAVALAVIIAVSYIHLTGSYTIIVPANEYDFTISRMSQGDIALHLESRFSYKQSMQWEVDTDAGVLRLWMERTILADQEYPRIRNILLSPPIVWENGQLICRDIDAVLIKEIRVGKASDARVIYREGDELPLCPPKIEDALTRLASGSVPLLTEFELEDMQ